MYTKIPNLDDILVSITRTGSRFNFFGHMWEFGYRILDYKPLFRFEWEMRQGELVLQFGYGKRRVFKYLDVLFGEEQPETYLSVGAPILMTVNGQQYRLMPVWAMVSRKRWNQPRRKYAGFQFLQLPDHMQSYFVGDALVVNAHSPEEAVAEIRERFSLIQQLLHHDSFRIDDPEEA